MQTKHNFEKLGYLLHLPKASEGNSEKKWPLIIFLHGAGERGNDIDLVKKHGIAKIVENQDDFPFITVSPQCPPDSYWPLETETLNGLLDDIIAKYPVDTSRIYLTGLSMGGFGSWHLALSNPEKFAALAPICGGITVPKGRQNALQLPSDKEKAYAKLPQLKDLPIWAFHGDQDEIVPMEETVEIIDLLKEMGGNAKLTIYEGVDHDSWTQTYDNPELYEWFLKHSK